MSKRWTDMMKSAHVSDKTRMQQFSDGTHPCWTGGGKHCNFTLHVKQHKSRCWEFDFRDRGREMQAGDTHNARPAIIIVVGFERGYLRFWVKHPVFMSARQRELSPLSLPVAHPALLHYISSVLFLHYNLKLSSNSKRSLSFNHDMSTEPKRGTVFGSWLSNPQSLFLHSGIKLRGC